MRKPVLATLAITASVALFSVVGGAFAQTNTPPNKPSTPARTPPNQGITCPPGVTPPSPYCVTGQSETPKQILLSVQTLLKQLLGKQANVNALQKNGVLNFSFSASGPGVLTIKFLITIRPNGTVVSAAKNRTVVYAQGKQSYTAAGAKKITIRRTAAGKKIVAKARKRHTKVKITISSTFKPKTGAASTSKTTTKIK